MFDPLTFNCPSIVNKFTVCMNSVLIFWWPDEQMFLPIWLDEIGKNQDKSIKSDLPIYIDLSIDKSIPIFIDWLLMG